MSSETADARALQADDVVAYAERYGHLALVGVLMVFMLWVRLKNLGSFRGRDRLAFTGIDSWYHWRATDWTVQNFPWVMPYEVYTGFPDGNNVDQFNTLFDQFVALLAMLIGLGSPTQSDIYLAALIAGPILATLTAIPVYLIAKRVSGDNRFAGLVAVIILALSPGEFTRRSLAGNFDHHVAEALLMAVAIYALVVALRSAERDKPIWELVTSRDWSLLRTPTKYSVLAGVAITLYLWVWPAGIVLIGILGIFFAVQLALDFVRGVSPDHVAFVGVVSMAVTALFSLLKTDVYSLTEVTQYSLIQPALAVLVALGCLFMAWLARQWETRELERVYYPAAILGLVAAGLVVLWIALPDLYNTVMTNVTTRLLPIRSTDTALTVQEVQPPDDIVRRAARSFGMGLYLFILGLVLLIARPFVGDRFRAEHTLVIVWGLFLLGMAASQSRFWYYFVLPVSILSGYTIAQVVGLIDLNPSDRVRDVKGYQVLTILLVLTVLFVPFAPGIASYTAPDIADAVQPGGESDTWAEGNEFLQENTPEPGNLYGAGNESELDYYGTYERPADGDYDYPGGAYGVMSWWDYGHFITSQGERIPHANPFQQHARSASAFLQAPSEDAANEVLDAISAGMEPRLDASGNVTVDAPEDVDNDVPYVMIDHKMAGEKFPAIARWTGPNRAIYGTQKDINLGVQNESQTLPAFSDAYYDTQLARLYLDDASGMEHYRLVHEADEWALVGGQVTQTRPLPFSNAILNADSWGPMVENTSMLYERERKNGNLTRTNFYEPHVESSLKTFERVEGATMTGQVENATNASSIRVSLELETAPGRTFTYTQNAELGDDGSFEVTVPYATDNVRGPDEGYTDSSVTANGNYSVVVQGDDGIHQASANVSEGAVYDGESIAVDGFEFTSYDDLFETNPGDESDENVTDGNATDGEGDTESGSDNESDATSERISGPDVRVPPQ
ncbi:oligosaccharyl transferase, archaeosortase A system-associated [Halovivax limisalsi]|uniref:oligosaccharyl transferase, archaeosortase A system-associated n=1 Tax=Halovivax limisalsi TaxID=1453760 RepID=UPI001FFC7E32|nr:oligosaccharyl transferase, archaeosortase A system-associated [Halovivax limisalsi]